MKHLYLTTAILAGALTLSGCGKSDSPSDTEAPVATEVATTPEVKTIETTMTAEVSAPSTPEVAAPTTGLLNPNSASEAQLLALTAVAGTNPDLVTAFVAARPFENAKAMDSFLSNYMGEEARAVIYGKMFIPMNLNTTPEADFQIIPGVGKKMAHEFEEYRPYKDLAQFDKEIGKYVDADEVARLRKYVTLN